MILYELCIRIHNGNGKFVCLYKIFSDLIVKSAIEMKIRNRFCFRSLVYFAVGFFTVLFVFLLFHQHFCCRVWFCRSFILLALLFFRFFLFVRYYIVFGFFFFVRFMLLSAFVECLLPVAVDIDVIDVIVVVPFLGRVSHGYLVSAYMCILYCVYHSYCMRIWWWCDIEWCHFYCRYWRLLRVQAV